VPLAVPVKTAKGHLYLYYGRGSRGGREGVRRSCITDWIYEEI